MIDPKNFKDDPLQSYLMRLANDIEINLMLEGFHWNDPKERSAIIAMIIGYWIKFTRQDKSLWTAGSYPLDIPESPL